MPDLEMHQEMIEARYNRRHIDIYIKEDLNSNPDTLAMVKQGVANINWWMEQETYKSKAARIEQLRKLDIDILVMDIFVGIAYVRQPELFTSVAAKLASRLKFNDKVQAVTAVSEVLAMLCYTGAFAITKASKYASLMLVSKLELTTSTHKFIDNAAYLPPMVCNPRTLTKNYDSGYLTHVDSLLLGKGNHHNGELCLDVLNLMNSVPLRLCTDFLSTVEEEPTFDLDTPEKVQQWHDFKEQSYKVYTLMVEQGNRFYLTHKPDKRGRIYSQGYHINYQGTSFKKAQVELADEEIVEGVP